VGQEVLRDAAVLPHQPASGCDGGGSTTYRPTV
jgi:hypothetical protein